jgi:hypothetical protein
MRNPAGSKTQKTEDYVSNITLTTRMMSTLKVTVQAKLNCNNKAVTTSQRYKITEDSQHDTSHPTLSITKWAVYEYLCSQSYKLLPLNS